jgi:translation initiation factor 1
VSSSSQLLATLLSAASITSHDHAMADRGNARLVYSTGSGRVCPACGKPSGDCHCGSGEAESVPGRIVARLRMEKQGRGGKMVTVIDGLPRNSGFLKELVQDLKRACGTGGAVRDGAIELQGDLRERVRSLLQSKGFTVKG